MPYSIIRLNPKTYQVIEKDSGKTSYLINKKSSTCFAVINTETGKVHANCTSLQNAKAQLRLLYGIESGTFKPTGKPSKMGKGEVETPMEEYENYEEYGTYGDGMYIDTRVPVQHLRVSKIEGEGLFAAGTLPREDTVPPKETWKTFFSKHAKGKKFANAEDTHTFMRKVGELWRNQKNAKKISKAVESEAKKSMKLKLKNQLKSMKE